MPATSIDRVLALLCMACAAAALGRLLIAKLWQAPFPAFAIMLAVSLLRDTWLLMIPFDSHRYALMWSYTLIVLLAAQAWAAISTCRAISALYPRLGRFGTWLFGGCLALAALLCCAGLPVELLRISGSETFVRSMFLAYRWNAGLIAGALLLATAYLGIFPPPAKRLPRNLAGHMWLLAAYFSSNTILYLCENLFPLGGAVLMERLHWIVACALYLTWAVRLPAAGNQTEARPVLDPALGRFVTERNRNALDLARQAATGRR
ncbi:MAG TPA: hypothetical protein VGL97_21420 [Bryobacteraceae bacterium]|jgi:hypothetical protein